jgi:hypothetical protein
MNMTPFEWQIFLNALIAVGESFILAYYFRYFLERRFEKQWIYTATYICYFGINFCASQLVPGLKIIPLVTIFIYFCIAFILYKGTRFQRGFSAGLIIVYTFITETLSAVFVSWVSGHSFPGAPELGSIHFMTAILSRCVLFTIVFNIVRRRKVTLTSAPVTHSFILLAIVSICAFLSYVDMIAFVQDGSKTTYLHVLSEFAVVLLSVIVFFVFEKFQEYTNREIHIQLLEQQLLQDEKYFKLMDLNRGEMCALKHDFSNHLMSMHYLLSNNKFKDLGEYMQRYLNSIGDVIAETITGYPSIDALIAMKKKIATQKKIKFSYVVKKLFTLRVNPIDLNIVLSNFLDNAIEAAEESPQEFERHIELKIWTKNEYLYFKVANSSPVVLSVTDALPSTTKKDSMHHGLGLGISKKLVERYDGNILWEYKNGKFMIAAHMRNMEQPMSLGAMYTSDL